MDWALGLGYCWAFLKTNPEAGFCELMAFHRKEQMAKLRAILKSVLTFKRVDSFKLAEQ